MSRLYNEEWQRRKSMLIKSLFCDMAVLSPVPEETFESDCYQSHDPSEPYRPYSPLPPLIIEKEPNRHDDPEEYYIKLLNKIRRIYKKLFVENQSLDSEDFNITKSFYEDEVNSYESDVQMNVKDVDNDNISLHSNITINSEGYIADLESSNESIDNNSDMNVEESNDEQMDEENDFEPSNADNINQESNNVSNDNEMTEARSYETSSNDSNSESQDEIANTDINNQEMDISEVNKINEGISSNSLGIDQEIVDERNVFSKDMDKIVEERNIEESEVIASKNNERSEADEGMDVCDDEADDTFDAGIDYRQITTVALVHVDGSQQNVGRVSPVYETVTSPILPPGVVIGDEKREEAVLDEQRDPDQTSPLSNYHNTYDSIEEMRTPRQEVSIQSNPISRYSSDLSDNSPNIEITTALEIENTNHVFEPNISNDINDIITSFIDDSNKEKSENKNGRKRKLYEDISVQTSRQVSWDDVRDNFFVGTPKIFRLCRCVDHFCSSFN